MPCLSCVILQPINATAEQYAVRLFNVLAPSSLLIFQSFVGCWFVWKIIMHGILKPGITLEEFLKPLLIFSVITLALQGHGLFWEYLYRPIHDSTMLLLTTIIRASNQVAIGTDLNSMLQAVEECIMKIIQFCERVYSNAGWNIVPVIVGIILLIPFVFLWAIFMIYTVEYIFALLVVSALSPLLIVLVAFPNLRHHAGSALKVVLQEVLTVCISVIAMSLTLSAIDTATLSLQLTAGTSSTANEFSVFSGKFCSLFTLSLVAILFQLKAPGIAANIVGSQAGISLVSTIMNPSIRFAKKLFSRKEKVNAA